MVVIVDHYALPPDVRDHGLKAEDYYNLASSTLVYVLNEVDIVRLDDVRVDFFPSPVIG